MGCDWYDFLTIYSSGNAIMVTNQDIKETYSLGSSNNGIKETHNLGSSSTENESFFDHPLNSEEIDWLIGHAGGYKAYQIGVNFVLFTKAHNDMREAPSLEVPGPNEIEEQFVQCRIEEAPEGEEYSELFELAGKLTPPGRKLSFAPGKYSFSATSTSLIRVEQLKRSSSSSDCTSEKANLDNDEKNKHLVQLEIPTTVPSDFELIVGKGQKMKIIETNRALLFCFFPHLETLVRDVFEETKLELPELDPVGVQFVLDEYSSRENKADWPYRRSEEFKAIQKVKDKFGMSVTETHGPPTKKPKKEHPAMADPRWLDATFLAGPHKEEIKVNRSVLASMNPVLHRILFGTGVMSVDPSKPIEWPDFDAQAVRKVFSALVYCCKEEVVVPIESVKSAKALVDYLLETPEDLMIQYDTPFKREFRGEFRLSHYRNALHLEEMA